MADWKKYGSIDDKNFEQLSTNMGEVIKSGTDEIGLGIEQLDTNIITCYNDFSSFLSEYYDIVKKQESDIDTLTTDVNALTDAIKAQQSDINAIAGNIDTLSSSIDTLTKAVETQQSDISDIDKILTDLSEQLVKLLENMGIYWEDV